MVAVACIWGQYCINLRYRLRRTSSVAVGKDKSTASIGESGSVPDDLIHKTGQSNRVILGAGTSHDKIGEGDVVLVVVTVDGITTLPARREHDLQANTILTVRIEIGLVGHVVAVKSTLGGLVVVEAVEAKRTLFQIALRSLTQSLPRRLLRVRLAGIAE